ncbi:ABC transporter ATP-binding protein [Aquabacter spiritensis]|uniref:NitT/TauT family transport system ATP-binding protein n=1 Tax=Aquabacter spiritensis TaxID=933073 RepID=A0A4R3LK87_9HYPH|nr:ABC transporter ATP-binding protein [Aquabacter spiritensis]TCT00594.1 NitT/TauT family transport system ATP-binding protein [Aquabacter spiritensis]
MALIEADAATASETNSGIGISNVTVVYGGDGGVTALKNINLQVKEGEFVSLVGASGCGKSTLLKVVADLMPPTGGQVTVNGLAPSALRKAGRLGLVFQQANLMPWLNIRGNIGLLKSLVAGHGGTVSKTGASVDQLIDVVGLTGFGEKFPHQLSGGMQQRAALARALALDPAVLLMDEPFAALDEITRDRMAFELMRVWQQYRKTVLFVTHSLSEAVMLSDRVVLMSPRPGRIHRIFDIDLPRPRTPETRLTEGFSKLVLELNRELYEVMT